MWFGQESNLALQIKKSELVSFLHTSGLLYFFTFGRAKYIRKYYAAASGITKKS